MSDSMERLVKALQELDRGADMEGTLKESTTLDAIRRLAEMRLVALAPSSSADSGAVLGVTSLGQRVLIGLLFLLDNGMHLMPDETSRSLKLAAITAAQILPFDETPEDLRRIMEDVVNEQQAVARS